MIAPELALSLTKALGDYPLLVYLMTRPARAQTIESSRKSTCNLLGQNVSGVEGFRARRNEAGLHAPTGERKYVNRAERSRILAAMEELGADQSLFGLVWCWPGRAHG